MIHLEYFKNDVKLQSILEPISGIEIDGTIYFKKKIDNLYIEYINSLLEFKDKRGLIANIIYSSNKYLLFNSDKIEIKRIRHNDKTEKYRDILNIYIRKKIPNDIKYYLINFLSKCRNKTPDDLNTVITYIESGKTFYNISTFLENKKTLLKYSKIRISDYLSKFTYTDMENISYIKDMIPIFDELKLDKSIIIKYINDENKKRSDFIKNIKCSEIPLYFSVPNVSQYSYKDLLYCILKYTIPEKDNINKRIISYNTKVDIYGNNIESQYIDIEKNKKFKMINKEVLSKINIDIILDKVNNSNISNNYKSMLNTIITSYKNNVSLLLCIDSLSSKFEGIIREYLKNKKIDTTYIDEKKTEELTLGSDNKGLIKLLKEAKNTQINEINYINLILNEREFYNIRNKSSHSFFNENDYNKDNFLYLLVALDVLLDIIS